MEKKDKINAFLETLKNQSINDTSNPDELGDVLKNFSIFCKKCGSGNIFVSWEDGTDYGGYTGYSEGQKLFKCMECGNAASFWS